MHRRALLAVVGGGTASLAGCSTGADTTGTDVGTDAGTDTTGAGDGTDGNADVPEDCPTSQGLDVEWPLELDASAVEAFIEEYEHEYYRDAVVEYEPESRLDSYELGGRVSDRSRSAGGGWELAYSGGGPIYRPTLALGATTSDLPEGADPVPLDEFDDDALTGTLEEAAETGEAEFHVDPPGERVDRYVDLFASLSDDFERLSDRNDSDALYVDVDGTAVELSVAATDFHGDYWWEAWYYVDERVVRRTDDGDLDPRNGDLLECRRPD